MGPMLKIIQVEVANFCSMMCFMYCSWPLRDEIYCKICPNMIPIFLSLEIFDLGIWSLTPAPRSNWDLWQSRHSKESSGLRCGRVEIQLMMQFHTLMMTKTVCTLLWQRWVEGSRCLQDVGRYVFPLVLDDMWTYDETLMKCMMFNKIDFFNVNSSQLFGMHFQSRTLNSQKQNDKILCDEVEKPDGTNLHSLISHHISESNSMILPANPIPDQTAPRLFYSPTRGGSCGEPQSAEGRPMDAAPTTSW